MSEIKYGYPYPAQGTYNIYTYVSSLKLYTKTFLDFEFPFNTTLKKHSFTL